MISFDYQAARIRSEARDALSVLTVCNVVDLPHVFVLAALFMHIASVKRLGMCPRTLIQEFEVEGGRMQIS